MTDLTREQIAEYAVRLHPDFDGRGQLIKTLARQLLATLDALAEAQAAQAGVVSSAFEAGAKAVHDEWVRAHQAGETPPRGEPDFSLTQKTIIAGFPMVSLTRERPFWSL